MKKSILTHTPIPFSDEFLAGFFLRASYINGYQSPKQMLNSTGMSIYTLSYEAIFTDENKLKKVIEHLNFSDDLLKLVIRKTPPTFQYFFWNNNQIVQPQLLSLGLNKFCPICLKNNGYWRKNWLLNPLTVCLEHKITLTINCPNCHDPLPVNRRSLFECTNCHYDLREHQSESSTQDDINTNHWFLDNLNSNSDNFVEIFYDIWIALVEYFSNLKIEVNNSFILRISYDYFKNEKYFIAFLIQKIEENLVHAHPRIQLLPFFQKKSKFEHILAKLLSHFKDYKQFSSQIIDRKFNKNEARHILGVSFSSFHKRLNAGILYHDQLANNKKNSFNAKILEDWLINDARNINGTYEYRHPPHLADESNHYFTIPEMMKILDINNINTRLFLKIPDIPTTKKYLNRYTQLCLHKDFINDFNKKYIFLSPLAKQLDVSPLTLRDKLSSLKIDPIHINKLYPAFYARTNIQHLDKSMIENIVTYKNNLGRKKKGTVIESDKNDFINLNDAAKLFNLSSSQIAQLIKQKCLLVEDINERPYRIPRRSIDLLLQSKNDPSFISIDDVLKALNCTVDQLDKNWIMTGYLRVRNIGYWQSLPKRQVDHVLEIHKDFCTASEANYLLGMHRTHITNLVSRGLIKPYLHGNHNYSVRLFKREDVKKLLEAGYGKKNLNLYDKNS